MTLQDRTVIDVAATVITVGFVDEALTERESALMGTGYVAPGMIDPAAVRRIDWSSPVLVRGLGATFFDLVGLISGGRHRLAEDAGATPPPGLVVAGSVAGLPIRQRSPGAVLGIEPRTLDAAWVARSLERHAGRGSLDFEPLLACLQEELEQLFDRVGVPRGLDDGLAPFDTLSRPALAAAPDGNQWEQTVDRFLAQEAFGRQHPFRSPWLAGRELVARIRTGLLALDAADAFTDRSALRRRVLSPTARVTVGPPAKRMRALTELVEQGSVRFVGPHASFERTPHGFAASSAVSGLRFVAPSLIEARQSYRRASRARDELVHALVAAGAARFVPSPTGDALDADGDGRLIGRDGDADPTRFVLGSLASAGQRGVGRGPRPGVADPFLVEADKAAAAVAALLEARRSQPPFGQRSPAIVGRSR